MPALVVTVSGRRYILPEAAVVQIVRLRTQGGRLPLDRMPDGACLRWRSGLLPVVDMVQAMDGRSAVDATPRRSHVVVVVQTQGRQLGLLVDAALEIEEVVVKSLAASVNPHGVYSGATILGDGDIAPILDIGGLVRLTGLIGIAATADERSVAVRNDERLLVCRAEDRHYAVPADRVRHVIRMPLSDVHWNTGAGTVVRVGEELHAVRPLTSQHADHGMRVSVVQVSTGETPEDEVLLLVDTVLDVIVKPALGVPGRGDVTSTVLHDGAVVDVLELASLSDRYVA